MYSIINGQVNDFAFQFVFFAFVKFVIFIPVDHLTVLVNVAKIGTLQILLKSIEFAFVNHRYLHKSAVNATEYSKMHLLNITK